jgi:asparagine synthase (glutamine-hydrolysing)
MCGIAGILLYNKDKQIEEHKLVKLRDALFHRGPDYGDHFINGHIGLAHRRLSILDLSAAGNQPMFTADGRYVIVFNGEIYNFKPLRQELEFKGYTFRSNCDTEVLLYLYAAYGPAMLDKLNGMFAFAIWDKQEQALFAARDRIGIKPFYYTNDSSGFMFASEPKAFFKYGYPMVIDDNHMGELLLYRFVAGENTLFKGVKKLLPGHYIHIKANNSFSITRWWTLADKINNHPTIQQPQDWFKHTFDDSVRNHMISDVPVGVLLSGGLDSSSICASLYEQGYKDIQTFNVGFTDFVDNESDLAQRLSADFKFPFHSIVVEDEDLAENLSIANYIHDEPLVHQNEPQIIAISRFAKKHVTVLLSGEGSDEFLGGYVRYKPLQFQRMHKLIHRMLTLTPDLLKSYRLKKLQRYFNVTDPDMLVLTNASNNFPEEFIKVGINITEIHNDYRKKILAEAKSVYPNNPRRQAMYLDQHTYVCSLNDRNDRATMAASIECRVPFLDHRLAEGLGTLSDDWLFKGKKSKYILKQAYAATLPDYILNFRKIGFSVPWIKYIQQSKRLSQHWNDLEKSDILQQGLLQHLDFKKLREQSRAGDFSSLQLKRQLFFISLWWKQYQEDFNP